MHYYTYAYLREDRTPYYIGKGPGKRIYSTHRKIKPPKDKTRIIYLKQNITEEEAIKHEIYMIDVLGRKHLGTGILRNLTDGGEGCSGRILSEESKRKIGESHKGKNVSEESKRKISIAGIGRTHSEESKRKIGDGNKGRTRSEESKKKMSEAGKGKTLSEEHKIKLSEVRKGRKWWNDGCGNRKWVVECPGDGWILGMKYEKHTK